MFVGLFTRQRKLIMKYLSKFAARVKEFMQDENISVTELAKQLNFNRVTLSGVLNGNRYPSTKLLIAIVCRYECSAHYVLGLTDIPPDRKFTQVKPFKDVFAKCLSENKISQYKLQNDLHLSHALTYNWLYGKSVPSVTSLIMLAENFCCSVDYLLGREN